MSAPQTVQRWQDIAPADAVSINLRDRLDITAPLTMEGERCPWPWEPQQLVGVPMGQYHCGYCGEMVIAGVRALRLRRREPRRRGGVGVTTRRRLVVLDTETSGLADRDVIVEIAWWDVDADRRGHFIPAHDVGWVLEHAHPDALQINGYNERLLDATHDDGTELLALHHALRGQCMGGSNIRYDAAKLSRLFAANGMYPEPWHYHLVELSSYAAGVLGLDPCAPPGLARCCDLLGVTPGDHTAVADVTATGECFKALMAKAGVTIEKEGQAA